MTTVLEAEQVKKEAQDITHDLTVIFKNHLSDLINSKSPMQEIVHDIVEKTLVCKTNRDNPNYPMAPEFVIVYHTTADARLNSNDGIFEICNESKLAIKKGNYEIFKLVKRVRE